MKLLLYPNKSLTTYCHEVKEFNEELWKKIDEMKVIMETNNGMGLAANQCGLEDRIFIMKDLKGKIWEFINPEIVFEDGAQYKNESCLSFPGLTVQVKRPEQISIKAFNGMGEQFHISAIGLEAICISHEIEHLNGTTFLNNLSRIQKRDAIKRIKK